MTRLLATTAVGLFLGLTPAFAQADPPAGQNASPPAVQQPAQPSEMKPSEPASPSPDAATDAMKPADPANPGASTEAAPPATPAPKSSEAPESIIPDSAGKADKSAEAESASPQFLAKQDSADWLASDLIGRSVVNASNESIGEINDLITDEDGKIVAALIGAGGFLGIGQKDVAVRFEDLKLARDENGDISVMSDLSNDTLASAPDYETLSEQQMTVGAAGDQSAPPSTTP
jgi:hypothetical protein